MVNTGTATWKSSHLLPSLPRFHVRKPLGFNVTIVCKEGKKKCNVLVFMTNVILLYNSQINT
jgi:hypothetical protein